jgi:hypothetical protein
MDTFYPQALFNTLTGYFLPIISLAGANIDVKRFKGEIFYFSPLFQWLFSILGCEI